jgi:acylphosphatase
VTGQDGRAAEAGAGQPGHIADALSKQVRLTAWVRGRVQGVGFRWWVRSNALELGLLGAAENLVDGRVKIVAEGNRDSCAALLQRLESPGTPGTVVQVTHRWDQARGGLAGFVERLFTPGFVLCSYPAAFANRIVRGRAALAHQDTAIFGRSRFVHGGDLGRCQLDRMGVVVGPWRCYLRATSVFLACFCVRDHSGHSVWRTSSNGEGSAWPCRRA